ncbi:acyl-CoA dehydrogenase family protein [Amycolatopsis sp. PS_44_ISF1]|uniref:acyl-CoA dehydrogenase family protein n=1 Tax=Amycolatopsis sp. PS_44_ISF1 TaxID=2974917 RepID=UPI0028E018D9|nr:acyl-CoA dehydrogenase family protein [Amycolatopsis sp. PS_44_ISF1]MDT8914933.1 acyl-CoA dehydrogenase family protein [Amycolatopsis sp. PS_44_ISF1]
MTTGLPETRREVVARARELRPQLAEDAVRIDAEGADPTENLRRLGEAGLQRVNVPAGFGGLWDGGPFGGWRETVETIAEVSAADGSTGQCWATTALVAREVFGSDLDPGTKRALAGELMHEGRRFVASNAETGGTGPVTGRRVAGGLVVDGTKTFNTDSGGGGRDLSCVSFTLDGETPRHRALVRLDDPALEARGDWDNMGQRGTCSQTIVYHDVFVPDGWHFASAAPDPYFLCAVMLLHAALLQGIGEGAFEAAVGYLRELDRPSMPRFGAAATDPLIHRQLGEMSSELAASRALLVTTAAELEDPSVDAGELGVRGFRSKVASTRAGLDVASRVHDLTGARSTSNRYRFDRFWRNARTFGSHDSLDVKNALIGDYELSGQFPVLSDYVKF